MSTDLICFEKLIKLTFNPAGQFNHLSKLLLLCISTLTLQGDLSVNRAKIDMWVNRRHMCESLCQFSLVTCYTDIDK